MDDILDKINASIYAVDAQLDFEKIVAAINKRRGGSPMAENTVQSISRFIADRSPTRQHCDYFIDVLVPIAQPGPESDHSHEVLELLLNVCQFYDGSCRHLLDITKQGADVLNLFVTKDAFVRYDLTRLLRRLYSTYPIKIVTLLLSRPDVLADLVEMTGSGTSAFLRNEVLSFLVQISADPDPDLPSIIAYQGVTESIFDILMEEESGVSATEVSVQAIECLRNLVTNVKCSRYIRESGGCDLIAQFLEYALAPIIDHAHGIASIEDDDPESLQARINAGWAQTFQILIVADILMSDMESPDMKNVFVLNGLVGTLLTAGESLYLDAVARSACYSFIAHMVTGSEHIADSFVAREEPTAGLPMLWSLFRCLFDERTPIPVRAAIDSVVAAVCAASHNAQQQLVLALGLVPPVEDPLADYDELAEAPGRVVTSVLLHAAETVQCSIPDTAALAQQVWFALMAIGHFMRGNPEIQRSAMTLKMSDTSSLLQLVVRLVKNSLLPPEDPKTRASGTVVAAGAMHLLTEWTIGCPMLAAEVVGGDIELVKLVSESVCKDTPGRGIYAVFVGVLLTFSASNSSTREIVQSIMARIQSAIGLPQFNAILQDVFKSVSSKRKTPGLPPRVPYRFPMIDTLPTIGDGLAESVKALAPLFRQAVLDIYLGVDSRTSNIGHDVGDLIAAQHADIASLQAELAAERREFIDYRVAVSSGTDAILQESRRLSSLLAQLRRELQVSQVEIARLELMKAAEAVAMKQTIEELQQQVNALVANYNQLSELNGTVPPRIVEPAHL